MATEDEQSDYAKRRDSAEIAISSDRNVLQQDVNGVPVSSESLQKRDFSNYNGGFAGTSPYALDLSVHTGHPSREGLPAVYHIGDEEDVRKTPVAEGQYPLAFITADIDRNVRLADGTIYNAAHGDTSALDAATQNLGQGQSVQDAGMEAVEASATAAAQETRDRMRAGRDGITSPPSAWAQDVNNLFAGLTSAARRAAERLSQPQQAQAVQPVQNPVQNQQDPFSMVPPPSSVQPIKKAGMMVLGAQDFGSPEQAKADEFIGGYFD